MTIESMNQILQVSRRVWGQLPRVSWVPGRAVIVKDNTAIQFNTEDV